MKQILTILFLLYYSTLFSQLDSSRFSGYEKTDSIGNYRVGENRDTIYETNVTSSKHFLFSDTILRLPNYFSLPGSIYQFEKKIQLNLFHTTSIYPFNKVTPYLQIGHSETFLFYQIGSANTQHLFLNHMQRINEKLSLVADYSRNKSDGFYSNQKGLSEQLNVQINYLKSQRYTLIPFFHYQKIFQTENGGIKNDSLFSQGEFDSPLFLETNLNSSQNEKQNIKAGVFQNLNSKSKSFRLQDEISYQNQKRAFINNLPNEFYDTTFMDSTITFDKYRTEIFSHEIKAKFYFSRMIHQIGIKNEFLNYSQNDFDTTSFENTIKYNLHNSLEIMEWDLNFDYVISGYNSGDFIGEINVITKKIKQLNFLKFNSVFKKQTPDILFSKNLSNHYLWENSLIDFFHSQSEIYFGSKIGELKIQYDFLSNYVYLDELKIVRQSDEEIQRIEINYFYELNKKKFYWRNDLIYQNVLSGNSILRVPDLILRSEFKFKTHLKAMELNLGIIANYRTLYFANSYDPSLHQFYLQNESEVGNYPIFDFYVYSTIKTVDLKFTVSHLNSGLTGFNYYATPLYPIAPRAFYFGLSWHFKD